MARSGEGTAAAVNVAGASSRVSVYERVDRLRSRWPRQLERELARPGLVERFQIQARGRVAVVAAPPGYGKTIFLRQWGEVEDRPITWLSCEHDDADPVVFLRDLATAIDATQQLPDALFDALDGSTAVAARGFDLLGDALATRQDPFVVVVDNCHELAASTFDQHIATLIGAIPVGSLLVLSGRRAPAVPLGRLRLEGGLAELGPEDLAFSREDTTALLKLSGVDLLGGSREEGLYRLTEGWVGGLRLAIVASESRNTGAPGPKFEASSNLQPGSHELASYMSEEILSNLDADLLTFLEESTVFIRVSGECCDTVLGRTGSADYLEDLTSSNSMFLSPLDDQRHWYRYHGLFTQVLQDRLRRRDPLRYRELHRRAAQWWDEEGSITEAVRHAIEAGDRDLTGRLVLANFTDLAQRDNYETIGRWIREIDEDWLTTDPNLVFAAALHAVGTVDPVGIERWLEVAKALPGSYRLTDGTPSLAVGVAMLTAIVGRFPIERTHEYTDVVVAAGRTGNRWWALANSLHAASLIQMGEVRSGRELMNESIGDLHVTPMWFALGTANLALAELTLGNISTADQLADEAWNVVEANLLIPPPYVVLVWAVRALLDAKTGAVGRAKVRADGAIDFLKPLGDLRGYGNRLLILAPVLLADVYVTLGELDLASELCVRARAARIREPKAGLAIQRLEAIQAEILRVRSELPGGITLTEAERRVLVLLPTHQTMQELAEQLYVSRNTVKTHALSLYRKLGVSSRSDAVRTARSLHLLPLSNET